MSRVLPANDEYYHVYNRGVEKRLIVKDGEDAKRFLISLDEFNSIDPIGSLYENSFHKDRKEDKIDSKLVEIVCYCLNPNHYHLLLRQVSDNGVSEFMKRLGGGYTWYFNNKYKRTGALFQGKYKAIHIDSNEYLLRLSAYINKNDEVHKLGGPTAKFVRSSWAEYINLNQKGDTKSLCAKDVVLGQFSSIQEYKKFTNEALKLIRISKDKQAEMKYI